MTVRIRLRRTGAKKQPSYRVVVADSRAPRDGRFLEIIGHYNPLTNPPEVQIDEEKARLWLKRGAQPSEAVAHMLSKAGILPTAPKAAPQPESAPEPGPEATGEPSEEE